MMLHETPIDVYRIAEHAKKSTPLLILSFNILTHDFDFRFQMPQTAPCSSKARRIVGRLDRCRRISLGPRCPRSNCFLYVLFRL